MRAAVDLRLGVDIHVGDLAIGPYAGFLQIIEPSSSPNPEDARLGLFGLHAELDLGHRPPRPDPDRDMDGIADRLDRCPDVAEDRDGFEDQDGCPDLDNDRDRIADVVDRCPDQAEDYDGFEDADGCPDLDNDKDGIADAVDGCPDDPEDMDGFDDLDGCPDRDNDKDGIADAADLCPNEAETFNGNADEDGCPDSANVQVQGDHFELGEHVLFAFGRPDLSIDGRSLVEEVASILRAHPEYALIQIEGHADEIGDDYYNMELSRARATSVRNWLARFGVDPSRMTLEAYGKTRPVDPSPTVSARKRNRRVEFRIATRRPVRAGTTAASEPEPMRISTGTQK
jgi:outer membrane protein OmpA-like peptidoglycan-associated protein